MPFTPAHAAAALPLSRLAPWVPVSALVVGTLTPDFEYFLRLAPRGGFGHTPLGLFVFCLPLGLFVWSVWQRIVRPALLRLLPQGIASAITLSGQAVVSPAQKLLAAAVGVLLGAISHDVWDSFTHEYGWAVVRLSWLGGPVAPGWLGGLRWFKVLQHGSTVLGGAVLVTWMAWWLWRQPTTSRRYAPGEAKRVIRVSALLLSLAAVGGILNGARVLSTGPATALGYAAVGSMSALAVVLLGYGLWARHRFAAT